MTATNIIGRGAMESMYNEETVQPPWVIPREFVELTGATYNDVQLPSISNKLVNPSVHGSCFLKTVSNITGSGSHECTMRALAEIAWTFHEADLYTVIPQKPAVTSMTLTMRELKGNMGHLDFVALKCHPRFEPFVRYNPDRIGMCQIDYNRELAEAVHGPEEAARVCSMTAFRVIEGDDEVLLESAGAGSGVASACVTVTLQYTGLASIAGATPGSVYQIVTTLAAMLTEVATCERFPVAIRACTEW